jgi:hypothetical protein
MDLVLAAKKIRVVVRCNATLGLAGRLSSRLQPNHPTDDVPGVLAAVKDGLSFGNGDAVIGVNPATGDVEATIDILKAVKLAPGDSDLLNVLGMAQAAAGVNVQGVFETTGSQTASAELRPMYCAGLNVRQDGNRYVLHHKVVIIDDHTVVTGSFNFSASATESNDENLLVIRDPDLAALYIQEFERRFAESRLPDPADMGC